MKTTVHKRLARLAGLLVLSLLVAAIGIQAAQAATVSGTGAGSGAASFTTPAQLQGLTAVQLHHYIGKGQSMTAVTASAGTQGRGGVAVASITPNQPQGSTSAQLRSFNGRFQPTANVLAAQATSPGTTSTSAWIIAGSAAAVLLVGLAAWTLTRRQKPGQLASADFCSLHPEDSLCTAA